MADSHQQLREKLNFTTKLAYGAGDLGPAITANILVFYLLPFFTNVAGLSPGWAGSILMIGKISDAINDPIIGVLSDRTHSPWGRRLPWIFWGSLPFGIIFVLQWLVPHFSDNNLVNQWCLLGYYILIAVLFNLAYTCVNLPYQALTPELTQDYNERTNLNSFRFTFSIGGSIVSLLLAKIIFATYPYNPAQGFLILGLICALLSVIPLFWCVFRIQERGANPILNPQKKKSLAIVLIIIAFFLSCYGIIQLISGMIFGVVFLFLSFLITLFSITLFFANPEPHLIDAQAIRERSQNATAPSIPFTEQLKIVFSNKPFLYVIGIYLCSWLAVQLTASILVFFVVDWMGLSNAESPLVALAVQGTALVMLFFWKFVSEKLGKKIVYFVGTSIWLIAQIGLFLLQPNQIALMYFLAVIAGCGVSVAYLIPWSMVPDVIELDELQTGQRREGIFYGFMVLLQKFGLALGLFLVGIALEAAGFIKSVGGEPLPIQPESALLAIRIAIGPLPAIILIGGLILAYFYPITQEIHAEIRLQLQERNDNG
ncbi:MAG: MFS transporter [Gomphosphaeria aponina SAG 52.96 = DSM 107014]|uniref:MFS transporter n=1 Tax=Gomphosphaeria aponina SAG 52.96 = DSM 107014 TaxID=1521640 RepID=A0A941JQI2_9CHRO|nr:MFS transporter [Gomphosphaeria aponina SAG 52.96 = DSM 107014]